jgi:hypothetical protein
MIFTSIRSKEMSQIAMVTQPEPSKWRYTEECQDMKLVNIPESKRGNI